MRVSTNWLRELSGLTKAVSVEMIADKLTMAGLEVEAIEDKAKGFGNVVVGHILEKQQHPQADKLTLCLVNVGESEPVKIVCGAPNHKQRRLGDCGTPWCSVTKWLSNQTYEN